MGGVYLIRGIVCPMLLWLLACAPAPVPWCAEDPAYDGILARLDGVMARGDVPGAQLAIVRDGELVCSEAAGQLSRDDDGAVGRETRFAWGSITKSLTSGAAIDLEADGRLDLDAPITDQLPEFALVETGDPERDDADAITLRMALSHTAGLPDAWDYAACDATPGLEARALVERKLDTPPGLAWHYSNEGYMLAGLALERAGGRDYDALIDKRILRPWGLDGVTFDAEEVEADGDYASGLVDADGAWEVLPPATWTCDGWDPSAGAWGTATDLARLSERLLEGDEAAAEQLTVVSETREWPTHGYGLGLYRMGYGDDPDRVVWQHSGRMYGFLTQLVVVPDEGLAVAVLFNSDAQSPNWFALDAAGDLLGWGPPVSAGEYATDSESWDDYVGTWTYDGDTTLESAFRELVVWRDRDWLFASKDGGPALPMRQIAGDTFWLPDDEQQLDGDTVVFWREDDGSIRWLVSRGTARSGRAGASIVGLRRVAGAESRRRCLDCGPVTGRGGRIETRASRLSARDLQRGHNRDRGARCRER